MFSFMGIVGNAIGNSYMKAKSYTDGYSKVVEGEVCDFIPSMVINGTESFHINDVLFEYSNYEITFAYRKTAFYNGFIKNDGQMVRIHYITRDNINYIFKIEIQQD